MTLDVFHDVWRRASTYDSANGSVLGWILNQARSRAIDWLRFEHRKKRFGDCLNGPLTTTEANDPDETCQLEEQGRLLRNALEVLTERNRVSMLVRLTPGTDYPSHRHAGAEELHLLHGELMVNDKTLYPGDYIRAEAESVDRRVWSETGCTCVLLTSIKEVLF